MNLGFKKTDFFRDCTDVPALWCVQLADLSGSVVARSPVTLCPVALPRWCSLICVSFSITHTHTQLDGHEKHLTPTIFLLVAQ